MIEYEADGFKIKQYIWDVVDSNSFLILEGNNALLIDAIDSDELFSALECTDDLLIILTHCHFDHICGLNKIRKLKPNCKVYATSMCSKNIGNKYRNMSASGNAFMAFYNNKELNESEKLTAIDHTHLIDAFTAEPADVTYDEECEFIWKNHKVHLIQCYGHSNDSSIIVFDDKYLFSGDTLLGIPTVTRFPGGSTKRFWEEDVPKLITLKSEIVFPGHGKIDYKEKMIKNSKIGKSFDAIE